MKGAMLTLFTAAMRTAHFFITHRMCYEIKGDHVTNSPIAIINFEPEEVGHVIDLLLNAHS